MPAATTSRRFWTGLVLALALVVGLAWLPTRPCDFVFDDMPLLVDNQTVAGHDLWAAAFGRHTVMANRPLACVVFTAEHLWFGHDARGFRLVSVVLHFVNVLLLLAVVRGTLRTQKLAAHFPPSRAQTIAAGTAGLWAVHPLGADTVAYTVQQSMLLMSMFLLGALLALQAAHRSPARRSLLWIAVVCTALGMASKEEFAAAPLLLVLYERAFFASSWRELRPRLPFYAALAATCLVLLWCVLGGPRNVSVGFHVKPATTAFEWLMTQAGVVLHYLRLCLLPTGLRSYYDWPIVRDFAVAIAPGIAVSTVLGLVVWSWLQRKSEIARAWGWLGALLFLLLAPTSTILPIVTEVVAERRMYLPMLAVLVPVILGLERLLRRTGAHGPRLFAVVVGGLVVAGALTARQRIATYSDNLQFMAEAYEHSDPSGRSYQLAMILGNYGMLLRERGAIARSDELLARIMECDSPTPQQRTYYAASLNDKGQRAEAERIVRDALAEEPDAAYGHALLASVLAANHAADGIARPGAAEDPRLIEAEQHARAAVALIPQRPAFMNILAWVADLSGRTDAAEPLYRRAIELGPERYEVYFNFSDMLNRIGRNAEAEAVLRNMLAARPNDARIRVQVARELRRRDILPAAAFLLREAVRIDPANQEARAALAEIESAAGR